MKGGTLARTVLRFAAGLACCGLAALSCRPLNASSITGFYEGDPNLPTTGLTNIDNPTGVSGFNNGNPYFADVYESFVVPAGGWTVDEVFSNDGMDFSTATADWQIRSGMSSGNGGTVVASGSDAASIQTSTGLTDSDGQTIYTIDVGGLDIPLSQGTYWLTVEPVGTPDSAIIGTNGANAVDAAGIAIDNFPAIGENYLGPVGSAGATKFSMGLDIVSNESSAPEPGTVLLAASAFLGLWLARKARRTRES